MKGAALTILVVGVLGFVADAPRGNLRRWTDSRAFCNATCEELACFDKHEFPAVPLEAGQTFTVQVMQAIYEDDVTGSSVNASLLRTLGVNTLIEPPRNAVFYGQFKTYVSADIAAVEDRGQLVLEIHTNGDLGETLVGPMAFAGQLVVFGPSISRVPVNANAMPQQIEFCLLGAIDRRLALSTLGKRIVIGTRLKLLVESGPAGILVTPVVESSRFPTTVVWINDRSFRRPADPVDDILERCQRDLPNV